MTAATPPTTTTTNRPDSSNEPRDNAITGQDEKISHDRDDDEKLRMRIEEQLAALADDTGEINELDVVAEGEERTNYFIWLLVACSTISGLLFGK